MEGINFLKKPRLKNPNLIVAWPGMGEVAFKAASYLVEHLPAEEFAQILPHDFFYFTGSVVKGGIIDIPELPSGKFYFYKNPAGKSNKNDLIIFLSNAQPDLAKAEAYCAKILSALKGYKLNRIIGLAAMPMAIDHAQAPNIWLASTSKELNDGLKQFNLNLLQEGQVSGMNGLFLGAAKKEGYQGFCLLGEIPLYTIQIENPKTVHAILKVLSKMLNISLDLSGLIEQSHKMEDEINKLLEYLKLAPPAGPIGEEDIEKIKKTLSQITKLPQSIKERLEQLFDLAKSDLSKASELKSELDKWNVYKEYEDRFLDLFKKQKENDN